MFIHVILCFKVDFLPPDLCFTPLLFHLIVYTHYVSIHCSHCLCLLPFILFITHPSFIPPTISPTIRSTLFVQKAHHSIFSIFLLNLVRSLHIPAPFILTLEIHFLLYIHYPPLHRTTPFFFTPSFLTLEHTSSSFLSVCRLFLCH